jgi:2-keto-4-pentenoate hydratase/2-oxohepta-3-ene-1,7-dioic acid hydratase in catechol pathway
LPEFSKGKRRYASLKILRFNDDRIGVLRNGTHVVDVSEAIPHRTIKGPQRVMEDVIEEFGAYGPKFADLQAKESGVPLESVRLLAPIPRPGKCLAAFANYFDMIGQSLDKLPNEYFYKAPELVGPEGTVELPDIASVSVYHAEAELAFVVGKRAKNVQNSNAMDHVFGYVPFFDVSARGLARRTQFVPKGQDSFGPCGPWITTKDEVPDPHNLAVQSWVNGKPRQNYSTKFMAHKIPDQIVWLTKFVQLQPGDVVSTGTYHEGLGPVNTGDVLEIEIEGLGKARFYVKGSSPHKEAVWTPGPQPARPGGGIDKV